MPRLIPALMFSLSVVSIAAASEPASISDISVRVVDEGQVQLELTYPGGACDQPGEADVTAADNHTVAVTIPVTRTAEVCTDQLVPVHFAQVIAIEPGTQQIAATVLGPDGRSIASGSVEVVDVAPPGSSTGAGE